MYPCGASIDSRSRAESAPVGRHVGYSELQSCVDSLSGGIDGLDGGTLEALWANAMRVRRPPLLKQILRRRLLPRRPILPPTYLLPGEPDYHVVVVGDPRTVKGWGDWHAFFPPFLYEMAKLGAMPFHYESAKSFAQVAERHVNARTMVLPFYDDLPSARAVAGVAANLPHALLFNSPDTIAVLASKPATVAALSTAGVPTTQIITGPRTGVPAFSAEPTGTQRPVTIVAPSNALNVARHNTEFVDTIHRFDDVDYYVCLRAMAVGEHLLCAFPRLRPISDGSPSVHSRDTPLDAPVISAAYARLVEPTLPAIEEICRLAGGALGPGFYAHDLLPERDTGRLLVCETGIKFDDATYRTHLHPIANDLSLPAEVLRAGAVGKPAGFATLEIAGKALPPTH